MKYRISILAFFLIALTKPKDEEVFIYATEFVEKYSEIFLKSDLSQYQYAPRLGFYTNYDIDSHFNVILRKSKKDSDLLIINFYNFNKKFNLLPDSLLPDTLNDFDRLVLRLVDTCYLLNGSSYNSQIFSINSTQIKRVVETQTEFTIPTSIFKIDPLLYFENLDKLRIDLRIICIKKYNSESVLRIYITPNDYLIYIPDNNKAEFDIKSGTKINDNWYFYHNEIELDLS